MKFAIVQLSDLHIGTSLLNSDIDKANKISEFINGNMEGIQDIIIIYSGDLTQAGTGPEYVNFKAFVDKIKGDTADRKIHTIFAPGNHDCDFSEDAEVRDVVREKISKTGEASEKLINQCVGVQDNFFHFAKQNNQNLDDKLFWQQTVNLSSGEIVISVINSAWFSSIHENPGHLFYPIKKVAYQNSNSFSISVLHHPLNWFDPQISRELKYKLEENSDIILTGHEHTAGASQKIDMLKDQEVSFLEGGVLIDRSGKLESSFNCVKIDLTKSEYQLQVVEYNRGAGIYCPKKEVAWQTTPKTRHTLSKNFPISRSMQYFLNDLGVAFQHPRRQKLYLDDVFVYPDIEEILPRGESPKQTMVFKGSDFPKILQDYKKVIVTAGKNHGKTSMIKKVYQDLRSKEIIPLLISGSEIDVQLTKPDVFANAIKNKFLDQYDVEEFQKFRQLASDKKVLIIDDFGYAKLNLSGKEKFIDICKKFFEIILIFGDDSFRYDEIFSLKNEKSLFTEFKNFVIRPLGRILKDALIEKWICLGIDDEFSPNERIKKQEACLRSVEGLLDSKAIPSLPIYVLTLLQGIEAAVPTNAISGSHGYMYRFLIETEIIKIFRNSISFRAAELMLSKLIYFVFQSSSHSTTRENLISFLSDFQRSHSSSFPIETTIDKLIANGVFSEVGNSIKVARSYYLYYFVGKYLADGLNKGDGEIKETIDKFIGSLHVELHANIIICVCFHTDNSYLRDKLIEIANGLFQDIQKFDFSDDVSFIKDFKCELPTNVLEYELDDPEKERLRKMEADDRRETEKEERAKQDDSSRDQEEANHSINFNYATKVITVLGQMLRSYAGQIKTEEQVQLAETCFGLSMRSLKFIVEFLDENSESIVKSLLESQGKASGADEALMKNILYFITQHVSISIVEKLSSSIGAEDLNLVFKQVMQKDGSISTSIIDYSIKLNYGSKIPIGEMKTLAANFEKKQFALDSLKLMMARYLRTNPLISAERQQIVSHLGLSKKLISPPVRPN